MKKIFLAVFLCFLIVGCGSDKNAKENFEVLVDQEKKWIALNISDYEFEFKRSAFFPPPYTHRVRIEVENNQIVSIFNLETEEFLEQSFNGGFYTIDGIFNLIKNAFENRADEVLVEYNETFGFPISVSIDYLKDAVDDEVTITISSFTY